MAASSGADDGVMIEQAVASAVNPEDLSRPDEEMGFEAPSGPTSGESAKEHLKVIQIDWTGIHNLPFSEGGLILDLQATKDRERCFVLTSCSCAGAERLSTDRVLEVSEEYMDNFCPDIRDKIVVVASQSQVDDGTASALVDELAARLGDAKTREAAKLNRCKHILFLNYGVQQLAKHAPHLCGGELAVETMADMAETMARTALPHHFPDVAGEKAAAAVAAARNKAREQVEKVVESSKHGGIPSFPSCIFPWLYLGGLWHAKQTTALVHLGITHVVNVASQVPCYHGENAQMLDGGIGDFLESEHGLKPSLPETPVPAGSDIDFEVPEPQEARGSKGKSAGGKGDKGGSGAAGGGGGGRPGSEGADPRWQGLQYFHAKVLDCPSQQMLKCWEAASAFIAKAERTPGARVLVHCAAGVSRSTSTIVHYLMKREMGLLPAGTGPAGPAEPGTPATTIGKMPQKPEQWVEFLRERRRQARPNIGFMLQLRAHHRGMNQLRIKKIERRAALTAAAGKSGGEGGSGSEKAGDGGAAGGGGGGGASDDAEDK